MRTKALISCAVTAAQLITAQLICTLVFTYGKIRFSYDIIKSYTEHVRTYMYTAGLSKILFVQVKTLEDFVANRFYRGEMNGNLHNI